jgi:hypothetical protein
MGEYEKTEFYRGGAEGAEGRGFYVTRVIL